MSIEDKVKTARQLAGNIEGFSQFLSSKSSNVSQKAKELERLVKGSRSGEAAVRAVQSVAAVLRTGSNQLRTPIRDLRTYATRLENE